MLMQYKQLLQGKEQDKFQQKASFLHAFSNMKNSQSCSMGAYLTHENCSLGEFLTLNIEGLEKVDQAFKIYRNKL